MYKIDFLLYMYNNEFKMMSAEVRTNFCLLHCSFHVFCFWSLQDMDLSREEAIDLW